MNSNEARVWIINADPEERDIFSNVVTEAGGKVVGVEPDLLGALDTVESPQFPANANNPNVVVIAGDLTPEAEGGSDGEAVFMAGWRRGVLGPVTAAPGLGVLAIGSSPDPDTSRTAFVTNSNFYPTEDGLDHERWRIMISRHPDVPQVALPGTIERTHWEGMELEQILRKLDLGQTAILSALGIGEAERKIIADAPAIISREYGNPQRDIIGRSLPIFPSIGSITTNPPSPCLLDQMRIIRTHLPSQEPADVVAHSAMAMFETPRALVVLQHFWSIARDSIDDFMEPEVFMTAASDVIPKDRVDDIPDAFWETVGTRPISFGSERA